MITILNLALFTSLSSAAILDAETTRVAYSNCLTDFAIAQLDEKVSAGAFKKAAPDVCPAERAAMIDAIKKDELAFGSSASEAASFAKEEADGVLFSFTDGYAGYANSNTRPVKEE